MSLDLKKGGEFKKELIPQGAHPARVYEMIEIGTQDTTYGPKRKVRITFELPTEKRVFSQDKGEQPMVISKEFTFSSHEKSDMRAFIEACIGTGLFQGEADVFDLKKILGMTCLITVKHKKGDKGEFQYIDNISAMPKGMAIEEAINEPRVYELDKHNEEVFNSLPKFVQDKIKVSPEWKKEGNIEWEEEEESTDDISDPIDPSEIPF